MFSDSHLHLTLPSPYGYEAQDRNVAIKRAVGNGIGLVVDLGVDLDTSKKVVDLTESVDIVWGAVGLHPWWVSKDISAEELSQIEDLSSNTKVKFIGETGLDLTVNGENIDIQKKVFVEMIQLAKKVDLPLNMHCGQAHEEMVEIIFSEGAPNRGLLIHDSSPKDKEITKKYLELDAYISIGRSGLDPSDVAKEVINSIPSDRLVLETDSYGQSYREENYEPSSIVVIAKNVADIRGVSIDTIEDITTANLKRLMRISH